MKFDLYMFLRNDLCFTVPIIPEFLYELHQREKAQHTTVAAPTTDNEGLLTSSDPPSYGHRAADIIPSSMELLESSGTKFSQDKAAVVDWIEKSCNCSLKQLMTMKNDTRFENDLHKWIGGFVFKYIYTGIPIVSDFFSSLLNTIHQCILK